MGMTTFFQPVRRGRRDLPRGPGRLGSIRSLYVGRPRAPAQLSIAGGDEGRERDAAAVEPLQRILERNNSIPVVLNTAFSSYRDNYLTWAADAYVTKSSDVTELLNTVKNILEERLASRS